MARSQQTLPLLLRPMQWYDLDQVAAIERDAFPTLWPGTSYRRELRNRQAEYSICEHREEHLTLPPKRPRRSLMDWLRRRRQEPPLEAPRTVPLLIGYVGLWYMAGEAHIVSIAVRETYRGQGVGELLMLGAVEMALRRGCEVLTLEVRVSNEAAQRLYEKYGFKNVGLRRRYYSDNGEDAYIMSTESLRSVEFESLFDEVRSGFEERYGNPERLYL